MKKGVVIAFASIFFFTLCWSNCQAQAHSGKISVSKCDEGPKVFEVFDEEPRFIGDENQFIKDHIKYPKEALDSGYEATVEIVAIIQEDGKFREVTLVSSGKYGLGEAAIRVVKLMDGKWTPGKANGHPVLSKKVFKISFNLPKDASKPKK